MWFAAAALVTAHVTCASLFARARRSREPSPSPLLAAGAEGSSSVEVVALRAFAATGQVVICFLTGNATVDAALAAAAAALVRRGMRRRVWSGSS